MIWSRLVTTSSVLVASLLSGCDVEYSATGAEVREPSTPPDIDTVERVDHFVAPAARGGNGPGTSSGQTLTYDRYSLIIDGEPVFVQAAEFHYFRLPSPGLWRDVLEKIKAGGFNGVSVYFHWGYHSPKPGVYDFTGVRDVDRFLALTKELGLYVVVRPGPYINAEATGGGFPAWLKLVPGRARTSAPGYTEAYREWLGHINPIIARHQITRGGSVILFNVENEYAVNTDAAYMEDLQNQALAAGIEVPITHNACCDAASWSSTWASGPGAVEIPGVDDYPQSFECANLDLWGPWGEGVTERLTEDSPAMAFEYQAGAIDLFNAGYDKCRQLTGPQYMKFFYKSNIIRSGATLAGYYMGFGGTNWGWLSQPNDVQTSYDYGAAITEPRQLTTKYDEFKRQGYFATSVRPLARTDAVDVCVSDNPAIEVLARANPDTGTQFLLVRHSDRAATTDDSATLACETPDGSYSVPVRVVGRDAKIFVAGYDLGGQRLVWSTSEIMTHVAVRQRDVALLYGSEGTAGSTVLRYASAPEVTVLEGEVTSTFDAASGDLRLDYVHAGLARVEVTGGGRSPLLLLVGTDAAVAPFWRVESDDGPILVRGTALVRSADVSRGTVHLRADTAQAGEVEVFAPASRLSVNGDRVRVEDTPSGSLVGSLPGPRSVRLPDLDDWRIRSEAPEAAPGFDDSAWVVADKVSSLSPIPPVTLPVLYADEYGFHYGHVWYRGRFTATGAEQTVRLNAITARNGIYLVWLNGQFLGAANGGVQADAGPPANPDAGRGEFAIPAGLLRPGKQATLAVLVENMGHNDDWTAEEIRHRQPRGLTGGVIVGSEAPISWRIQGARGGQDLVDRARGPLNNGGLFGERAGWHLPDFPDGRWSRARSMPRGTLAAGVTWFRTDFRLTLPRDQDVSVGLRFPDGGTTGYRALVFLNGWHIGHYIDAASLQREFVLPAGILRHRGKNNLAIAVIAPQPVAGGPGPVSLTVLGNQRGGVPVADVEGPGYRERDCE